MHDWTDEFDVAIKAADPSAPRPAWRLGEGFTAAEGKKRSSPDQAAVSTSTKLCPGYDILPHVARSRPDLAESHTALLLSSYLQADLPTALIEVTSVDIVAVINLRKDFWVCPSQS